MNITPMKYSEIADLDLIQQAANGSRESFGELVSRHQHAVRSMLWRVLGDATEVDDVAQDVFISALSSVARFRHDSNFQTWLLAIARNKAISRLRQKRTRAGRALSGLDQFILQNQIASIADGPVRKPRLDALEECLSKLSDEHRELVQQFYFDNRSASDLAKEKGQASNTIRMRLMRIRKALSGCIKTKTGEVSS